MDEHHPLFDPNQGAAQRSWRSFFAAIGRAFVFASMAAVAGVLLVSIIGCDSAELDRLEAAAEHRDRFYRGCMPRKGDHVVASWVKGDLICKRITATGRYGTSFPHVEVRIATMDEIEL
jgi:hypothetical protein